MGSICSVTGSPACRGWFGGWQASGWSRSNEKSFQSCLCRYLERGGNAIDTAEGYGNGLSEKLIGESIADKKREELVIATKFHHYRTSLKQIEQALDRSLRNLRCEYVDVLYQHWPSKGAESQRVVDALLELKERGKILAVGVSNWSAREFSEISSPSQIDVVQNCLSLLWRRDEEWLPDSHWTGVYLAYSPLAQGLLSGREDLLSSPPDDHRSKNVLFDPAWRDKVAESVGLLLQYGLRLQISATTLSLAWVLNRSFVSGVIHGSTRQEQLDDLFVALQFRLDQETNTALEKEFSLDRFRTNAVSLWDWHPRGVEKHEPT